MAFIPYQGDSGRVPPLEYHPSSAITPKVGMALKMSSGKLAAATGADVPVYIAMCQREAACTAGEVIPVIRVQPDMIFETTAAASLASVAVGAKVTLHTDSLQVTGTEGGAAELVQMDGTALGSRVLLRFAAAVEAADDNAE